VAIGSWSNAPARTGSNVESNQLARAEPTGPQAAAARCVWLTGLSGAGKSTLAHMLVPRLRARGWPACSIDGDALRQGLSRDLGFSDADRSENIRRAAELARLLVDQGVFAVVSLISPFRADRSFARSRFEAGRFTEVFVDAPLAVCEGRDPKGLYAKARRGQLPGMTGIDSAYEAPEGPELHLRTELELPALCVQRILDALAPAPPAQPRAAGSRRQNL
jgi:adenylyl-sulfate kinase